MKRIPVKSSNIASIGYEPALSTLEVEFKHGSIYQYSHVPQSVYEALMGANSHGSYFNRCVKDSYSYHKVR